MLHKCANPGCSTEFRQLRSGKLFRFESAPSNNARQQETIGAPRNRVIRRVEHYWLCDLCFPCITLIFDCQAGVSMVPLRSADMKPLDIGDTPLCQPMSYVEARKPNRIANPTEYRVRTSHG